MSGECQADPGKPEGRPILLMPLKSCHVYFIQFSFRFLQKWQEEHSIGGRNETVLTTALLKSDRINRKLHEI